MNMGSFSYICPFCGKGVKSLYCGGPDLHEHCTIFFLHKGVVVEKMTGRYDSYGRVFKEGGKHELLTKPIEKTKEKHDEDAIIWEYADWGTMVDMHFNKDEPNTGWAICHTRCNTDWTPTKPSKDDPNQGWGE